MHVYYFLFTKLGYDLFTCVILIHGTANYDLYLASPT